MAGGEGVTAGQRCKILFPRVFRARSAENGLARADNPMVGSAYDVRLSSVTPDAHFMKLLLTLALAAGLAGSLPAADAPRKLPAPPAKPVAYDDPAKTDSDFPWVGEYMGKMRDTDFAIQVIALGMGRFDIVMCPGGLPGAGWTKQPSVRQRMGGKREGEGSQASLRFSGNGWNGTLRGDVVELLDFKSTSIGRLNRVDRKSETLGAKPPEGAVVIFDGTSLEAFKEGAKMTKDGLLEKGCTTRQEFGDCTVHIEFRLPYMPDARGQARGNSGIYLAGRYEVQMLDSFGLNGENNECGGIYTVAKPQVNMCLPPLAWQTFDIDYQAPLFNEKGEKTSDAEITVRHNGVLVQDSVKVPAPTRSAPFPHDGLQGPLHLQDHGTPVVYRNIWVVKK